LVHGHGEFEGKAILYPQQAVPEPQSQDGAEPVSLPMIIAAAQPTPAVTEIAATGQLRAHAPHSMQRARSRIVATPDRMVRTPWGQTSRQAPQPVQVLACIDNVSPFLIYLNSGMFFLLRSV
jgi:hypothetical protein